MSERVRLGAEVGSHFVEIGWIEITGTGQILELYIPDTVIKMSSGKHHQDTRCVICSDNVCRKDVITGKDCLCCKTNHGTKGALQN